MYLLDTNTLIYFFKGMGNVADHLFRHHPKEIAAPAIVIYELEVGIEKSNAPSKRMAQLAQLMQRVNLLDFGVKEPKVSASIRAELEKLGTPIRPMNTLIAGIAKANHCTLVTHNTKEFERIAGLNIEDWF